MLKRQLPWLAAAMLIPALVGQTDPGNVPGLSLWLRADLGAYNDGGLRPALGLFEPVGIWADQSGMGNHALQLSSSRRPYMIPEAFNGKPAIRFLPSSETTITTLPFLDGKFQAAITVYTVEQYYNESTVLSDGAGNLTQEVSAALRYTARTPLLSAPANTAQVEYLASKPAIREFIYDGAASSLSVILDGVTYTGTQPAAGSLNVSGGITLGGDFQGKNLFQGDVAEVLVFNRALSQPERQAMRNYLETRYAIAGDPAGTNYLVFDGDSITWGVGSTGANSYPRRLAAALGASYSFADLAVPGQTTTAILADGPNADRQLRADRNNILLVMGGTNDLAQGAGTADLVANLASYCKGRRAAGYQVILLSMLPANVPGYEDKRQAVNGMLRSGWMGFADAFVDVGSDLRVGDPNAPGAGQYFFDAFHPNDQGYAVIADLVKPTVTALAAQAGSCVTGVTASAASFSQTGGTGTLQVSPPGCAFRVSVDAPWVTGLSYVPGAPSQISFTVAPNGSGAARAGVFTVGGQSVTVSQEGAGGGVPRFEALSPLGGNGDRNTFTVSFSDTGGYASLQSLGFSVGASPYAPGGCSVTYDQASAAFTLLDDGGAAPAGSAVSGTGRILRNSQCAVDLGGSFVSGGGNTLQWTLALSFFPSFRGSQTVFASAADLSGNGTGWQTMGNWTPN